MYYSLAQKSMKVVAVCEVYVVIQLLLELKRPRSWTADELAVSRNIALVMSDTVYKNRAILR